MYNKLARNFDTIGDNFFEVEISLLTHIKSNYIAYNIAVITSLRSKNDKNPFSEVGSRSKVENMKT